MDTRKQHDRNYRRILTAGLVLSFGAHVAVLAFAKVAIPGSHESVEAMRVVELIAPVERVAPLEVVRLPETPARAAGGGSSSAVPVREALIPAFASVPAVLAAVVPNPIALLEKIEEVDKPENPVASYAMITDFRADASDNPSSLRPVDDRPVAVLASLGNVGGSGVGVSIGGGHCPSPGGLHQIAFSRTGPTF
jgi:hypothetical protein